MKYNRMLKRGLAVAAALIVLMLNAVPLGAAGGVFVFSEHLADMYSFGSEKMGLMTMSGEVVLPAEHATVYRFGAEDEGAPELFAVGDTGETREDWYSYALYDAAGKKVTARSYTGFAWLEAGYIAATRGEGDKLVTDILDKTGKPVQEALPAEFVVQGPNGFVSQSGWGDEGIDVVFYDMKWKQIKKLTVDGLYTYNPPIDGKWFLPYREGEKWGYLDDKGEVAIKPAYDYANGFEQGGYAAVEKGGQNTLIDWDGKEVLPLTDGYYLMGGGQFIIESDRETSALIRASDLKEIVPHGVYGTFLLDYSYEDAAASGGSGGDWTAGARKEGGYDFFSADGKKIEAPDAYQVTLGNGYAIVSRGEDYITADNTLLNLSTGAEVPVGAGYGWFDGEDRIVMNDMEEARLYDLSGKEIAKYAMISSMYGTEYFTIQRRRFGQTRYGVIDKDGSVLLEPVYAQLNYDWESGVLAARKGAEEGYITLDGAWIYKHSAYNRLED